MSSEVAGLRELFRLIWSDATRFVKVRLSTVLSLVVVAAILTALGPIALKFVVDGFTGQPTGAIAPSALTLIGLYVLSQWLARSIGEIRGLVYARAERRLFRAVSERLFAHLMQLPLRFHLERHTGAVSQTLDNGLQGYQLILHHLVFTCLPVSAELGTIVLVLTGLKRPVFLILLCGALISYAIAFVYAATANAKGAKKASAAHVASTAAMFDGLVNYEAVKYFTAESMIQDKVSRALWQTEVEWVGFYRRYAVNGFIVATIFAGFLAATILYAAHEVQGHHMTVGQFVMVNTYMLQVVRPVEMLGYAMQGLSQGMAMLDKMMALFHEAPESQLPEAEAAVLPTATVAISTSGSVSPLAGERNDQRAAVGALEFRDVYLAYGPDRPLLQGVSFRIPAGQTLALVGASGSGKSSLVRLAVRFVAADRGQILLDGDPIATMPLRALRQAIAVVPQETHLFDESLGYNIGVGKQGATQEEIEQAAKRAHLHDFILSLPEQYNTQVGERGVKLSGGERQRLAIARAILKQPRIYILDEPTSSLDSVTESGIIQNLRDLARFSTMLVIAHRLSTVVHADEIAVLECGTIVESGTHAALLRRGGQYATLWRAQQRAAA